MKTIELFILFTLLSFGLYAQNDTTSINITNTQTERVIDKYGGKIADQFNKLIENTTPLAIEGFNIVVKLQIVKGIFNLLFPIFMVTCWFIFLKYYKIAKNDNHHDWIDGKYGNIALVFLILSIILTLFTPFCLYNGITQLVVPEWFAIKEILNLF
jgi:hypothetical protein